MSNEADKLAAEEKYSIKVAGDLAREILGGEHGNQEGLAKSLNCWFKDDFLAGASHIRSTVVAPLEAKLAELSKVFSSHPDDNPTILKAQLFEAQRVIKELKESLEDDGMFPDVSNAPLAPSEEKAE